MPKKEMTPKHEKYSKRNEAVEITSNQQYEKKKGGVGRLEEFKIFETEKFHIMIKLQNDEQGNPYIYGRRNQYDIRNF